MTIDTAAPVSVTGQDDIARLHQLASGIGAEFAPDADVLAALQQLNMRWIRCINVDPIPGRFTDTGEFIVEEPTRLLSELAICRNVGANPHIIIGQGLHQALRLTETDLSAAERGLMGNQASKVTFGPTDWSRFRAYCRAYFQYVLIEQKFPGAVFEVGNEPDIGGVVYPRPPKPANGSAELYQAYLNWYKNIAQAAEEFEQAHPGQKVVLGGPALAWAYTFKFGSFNWADRFVQDCAAQKIKLDFIGVHFYGNIASLDGSYPSVYPSFAAMYQQLATARNQRLPGVPIVLTEWGPSYHTNNKPESLVNADNAGAAWDMAFLNQMLNVGVDRAIYLVATDLAGQSNGDKENVWGWPSLFVNRSIFGKAYPKAPYYVFDFVRRLQGQRVKANSTAASLHAIAAIADDGQTINALIWNADLQIPENTAPVDKSVPVNLRLIVAGTRTAAWRQVRLQAQQVHHDSGNILAQFQREGRVNVDGAALRDSIDRHAEIQQGVIRATIPIAPTSVTFVRLENIPTIDH